MKITPVSPVPDAVIAKQQVIVVNPDVELADAVRAQLSSMGVSGLTVSAKTGEVTLKGSVKNGQELARIAIAVQKIKGVSNVVPDVDVKG